MRPGPDTDPALRTPTVIGANPALQLFDDRGSCTAYVSVWVVDWSEHGAGRAIVMWRPCSVWVIGDNPALGVWLAETFVCHFPELEGLPWSTPRVERSMVRVRMDLASGMTAHGGGVGVHMSGILDRRVVAADAFTLGGIPHSLSLVLVPCARGTACVRGQALPGSITVGGTPGQPSSSAFMTAAEVWRR